MYASRPQELDVIKCANSRISRSLIPDGRDRLTPTASPTFCVSRTDKEIHSFYSEYDKKEGRTYNVILDGILKRITSHSLTIRQIHSSLRSFLFLYFNIGYYSF